MVQQEVTNTTNGTDDSIIWSTLHISPHSELNRAPRKIQGTLLVDVDGTITVEGKKYKIDDNAIKALARFALGGGRIVFCSGATLGRIERTVLSPLAHEFEEHAGKGSAEQYFPRIFVMPENGSALLVFKRLHIVENELRYDWHRLHALHLPEKAELRNVLETKIKPIYPGSIVWGDDRDDLAPRDYILSLTGLKEGTPGEVITEIERLQPELNSIPWDQIKLKAARTTVDFVHADSGKTFSIRWLLKEFDDFNGPVLGLGDLGDEFAKVVPTFNVNKFKPNMFRTRGMPAMDLVEDWKLLNNGDFTVIGSGPKAVVRAPDDSVVQVLRSESGEIIFGKEIQSERGFPIIQAAPSSEGKPVQIIPLRVPNDSGETEELPDAGGSTSWLINRLIDIGYFDPDPKSLR